MGLRYNTQQLFYAKGFKQKIIDEVLGGKLNRYQATKIYGNRENSPFPTRFVGASKQV